MSSVIRRINFFNSKKVYLTFDDGPNPKCTPAVLDLLAKRGASATFFLVGKSAKKHPGIVRDIVAQGSALGNHSLDHNTYTYFGTRNLLRSWVLDTEKIIADISSVPTVGFRPPNGIITPGLKRELSCLKIPLITWNLRFFDTVFPWTLRRAERSLKRISPGSIVLLHDRFGDDGSFLQTLDAFLIKLKNLNYEIEALCREVL